MDIADYAFNLNEKNELILKRISKKHECMICSCLFKSAFMLKHQMKFHSTRDIDFEMHST